MSIELEGFALGFVLSWGLILPLGQQNMFVLAHAVRTGRFASTIPIFVTSALCDTLLIVISTLGLSLLLLKTHYLLGMLRIVGVCFLSFMGFNAWRESENLLSAETGNYSLSKSILMTIAMSLLNPHAILDTMVIIGANYFALASSGRAYFMGACVLVSWLWFMLLSFAGIHLSKFKGVVQYQGKVSALVMWMCAGYMSYQLFI